MRGIHRAPTRILAIEDAPLLAAHLRDHLRLRGFDVALRNDGEEGFGLVLLLPYRPRLAALLTLGAAPLMVLLGYWLAL